VGTVIDRAAPTDISALVELMSQFYAESNYALDRGWAAASFAQLLHDDSRGAAWIARFDGEPAGHIVLALRHSMEFGGLAGVIDDLFVRPEFRRRGIGSALTRALLQSCRTRQVRAVHVEVAPDNAAASTLYESFGLRAHNVERRTLTVQLGVEDHAG
jgi:ribosomal protein S18 acetylase RimI-like enzyme